MSAAYANDVIDVFQTDRSRTAMPYLEISTTAVAQDSAFNHRTGEDVLPSKLGPKQRTGVVTYPLWSFLDQGTPLAVIVEPEEDVWMAHIEALDLYGDGDTPREALRALEEHLENYIEFYRGQQPRDLTEFARSRRERFVRIRKRA